MQWTAETLACDWIKLFFFSFFLLRVFIIIGVERENYRVQVYFISISGK